ncbi:MAG: OmpA family protein [Acidobacteriaceae bacterium]
MEHSKLCTKGRWIAAVCVLGLGTTLMAQQAASTSSSTAPNAPAPSTTINPSRVDIFLGYSYLAPHGYVNGSRYQDVNLGAIGSGAYFFTKNLGFEAGLASHPDGPGDGFTTINAGPIARFPLEDGLTPFVHGLVGTTRIGGPNYVGYYSDGVGPINFVNPYRWGVSLTAGGGMDFPLPIMHRKLSWRVFQADYQYMHASFGPANSFADPNPPVVLAGRRGLRPADSTTDPNAIGTGIIGGRANIDAAQLSTGLVYHIGSILPPPPVAYTVSLSPSEVYPGDPITVTGNATNLNPKKTPTYSWTTTGGKISGTSTTATVDTTDLAPGTYTVTGHVTEGPKAGQSADANATFTVKQFEPPTISCEANPTSLNPGDSSTITAHGVSPQNRPLTYSYSASSGQVSGSNTTATLNTTGAAPGAITVTCNVADDKGQTASSTTDVTINAPPPPPAPKTETLCSISFGRDKRRPVRVDNEAKACLDDVALNLQRSADAKAVLVGSSAPNEKHADTQAAERAVNTKAYLVSEKGIDPSRIDVRTGNAGSDTVQNYLVPSGATFDNDVQGTTAVSGDVKASKNAYGHGHATSTAPHHRRHKAKGATTKQ